MEYNNDMVLVLEWQMKQKQKKYNDGMGINLKGLTQTRRPDTPFVAAQERPAWDNDASEAEGSPARAQKPLGRKEKFEYHSEDELGVAEQVGNSNVVEEVREEVLVAGGIHAEGAVVDGQMEEVVPAVVNPVEDNYLADFEILESLSLTESHRYNSKITPNKLNKVTFKQHLVDTYSAVKSNNLKAVRYLAKLVADDMEIAVREKLFKKFPGTLNELNMNHIQHVNLLVSLCKNSGKICSDELSRFAKEELMAYLAIGDVVTREKAANIGGFDVNQHFVQQNNVAFNALLAIAEQIGKDYRHRIKPSVLKHIAKAIQTLGKAECDVYRAFVAQEFASYIRDKLVTFCECSASKSSYNFTTSKKYSDTLRELQPDGIFLAEITVDAEAPVDEYNDAEVPVDEFNM